MNIITNELLKNKIANLPQQPGVYLMKNKFNQVIYVGKAKNLKNRVSSYFKNYAGHSVKTQFLVKNITDLELIITANELEALILECNLIKKYKPKYNVLLKDDKTYPYLKISTKEDFPRLEITRKVVKDGSKYYGPYTSSGALKDTLKLIRRIFPLRSCKKMGDRPCLEYHINRCLAPCVNKITKENYWEIIHNLNLFLSGKTEDVERNLQQAMEEAAANLQFEMAAKYRDQLLAIKKITEKQKIFINGSSLDIFGIVENELGVCIQIFLIRHGKMMGRHNFIIPNHMGSDLPTVLASFLQQYYYQAVDFPKEIILPFPVDNQSMVEELIHRMAQQKVSIKIPQRGTKQELLKMARENAAKYLIDEELNLKAKMARELGALQDLQKALDLPKLPRRMECFDISHIQGSETVASMVVFQDGQPDKNSYRRFKITSTEGKPDDFASMREVTTRRYGKEDCSPLPDLIIIDGGKGQLSSAVEIIRGAGHYQVPIVGLAKQFEWIFKEGESEPVKLPRDCAASLLIQHIRDEAHRFAITYHRRLRSKRNKISLLDNIEGIGPAKRKALYDKFTDLEGIKKASLQELLSVKGINEKLALKIRHFFQQLDNKDLH